MEMYEQYQFVDFTPPSSLNISIYLTIYSTGKSFRTAMTYAINGFELCQCIYVSLCVCESITIFT